MLCLTCADKHLELALAAMKMCKNLSSSPGFGCFCVGASNQVDQETHKNVSNHAAHPASINWAPTVRHHVPDADTRRMVAQLSHSSFEDKQHISLEMEEIASLWLFLT